MTTTRVVEQIEALWPYAKKAVLDVYGDRLVKPTTLANACQFVRKWYAIQGHRVDCNWATVDDHEVRFTIIPLEDIRAVTITGVVDV